jgi:hypothetical protein
MRTLLILVSVTALIAACSDQDRPTSPMSPNSRAASAAPSADGIRLPDASAAPAKYLRQIVYVDTAVAIQAGFDVVVDVSCPAGMTVTGGGFGLNLNGAVDHARVVRSSIYGTTKWRVEVLLDAAAPVPALADAHAICVGY